MQRFPGLLHSTGTGPRPRRRLGPSVEPLEPRGLMDGSTPSLGSILFPEPPAKVPPVYPIIPNIELADNKSGRVQALYELSLTRHPLYEGSVGGHVIKSPSFAATFTGEKRLELDVIGVSARVNRRQGLVLTGKVLGPIHLLYPEDFTFLIDRGGASNPGPIPGRPKITYDSTVTVSTGVPGGPTGNVSLLDSRQQATTTVALPTSNVRVSGTTVRVTVPAGLLPSTIPSKARGSLARYRYAFQAALPGGSPANVAGFAPEFASAMVGASTAQNR